MSRMWCRDMDLIVVAIIMAILAFLILGKKK